MTLAVVTNHLTKEDGYSKGTNNLPLTFLNVEKIILTWLLALIRICPTTGAFGLLKGFSMLRLASASSPKIDFAYMFAAINPH